MSIITEATEACPACVGHGVDCGFCWGRGVLRPDHADLARRILDECPDSRGWLDDADTRARRDRQARCPHPPPSVRVEDSWPDEDDHGRRFYVSAMVCVDCGANMGTRSR